MTTQTPPRFRVTLWHHQKANIGWAILDTVADPRDKRGRRTPIAVQLHDSPSTPPAELVARCDKLNRIEPLAFAPKGPTA